MKKVAIQGYAGSFHHIAAQQYEGSAVEILPCDTFRAVARAVERGEVDYGVMAIENSIAGSILPNYNILQRCNVRVTGEIYLQIRQNLMVNRGVKLEDIREVESHQMALLQCADYLDAHNWRLVETADTALSAAELQRSGSRTTAAVAGALAAELFDLDIIAADIHTNRNNYTRFLILERCDREQFEPTAESIEGNKASLYMKIPDTSGSLYSALGALEGLDINMSKLQSYPIADQPFNYMFHVDMEFGNIVALRTALERMRAKGVEVHVYGVYNKNTDFEL
ncbi:MAG: prephenate dehydratase [Alistipes sp.]|jgi:prephenate dehydratase|nr:prephenate dehydratase [Alistipes sp.]